MSCMMYQRQIKVDCKSGVDPLHTGFTSLTLILAEKKDKNDRILTADQKQRIPVSNRLILPTSWSSFCKARDVLIICSFGFL